jgi:CxxC-x17-CxxC domain-containing protein
MDFSDKSLICTQCGTAFLFTVGEQVFFNSRGFANTPRLCRKCRCLRKSKKPISYDVQTVCAECGSVTTVPFKPFNGKPIYCRSCFQERISGKTA